ncbi:MAG: DUF1887 family CARF protein [Chloroflexota bacterium]
MLLISLVGEQPIPNLLPIRYLKPAEVLLVYTNKTEETAGRLKTLILNEAYHPEVGILSVAPYHLSSILDLLRDKLRGHEDMVYNVTGGTKVMSIAAYMLAQETQSPIVYFQSEGQTSKLFRYLLKEGEVQVLSEEICPEQINIQDFLHAYLPGYRIDGYHRGTDGNLDSGGQFEKDVDDALRREGFETLAGVRPTGEGNQIEIDLVIRMGNQVGIAEVKLGDEKGEGPKKGIDQLALATQREYLGTYTSRFLIVARPQSKEIHELALAHNISLIEVKNPDYNRDWSKMLIQKIRDKLIPNARKRI